MKIEDQPKTNNGYIQIETKYDDNNNIIFIKNLDGSYVSFMYDELNRKTQIEKSDGRCVKYKFNENSTEKINMNTDGTWEKNIYDINNNKIQTESSNGKIIKYTQTEKGVEILKTYSNGNIKKINKTENSAEVLKIYPNGFWQKYFINNNKLVLYENSIGTKIDYNIRKNTN